MGLLLKRTSKTRQPFSKNSRLVTKSFDLGDPSLVKKFSVINITYKANGSGTSSALVRYKVDNDSSWRSVEAVETDSYSLGTALKKTSGLVKTASFKLPKNTKGRKIAVKIQHSNNDNVIHNFQIVDISFTYRGINRK